LKLFIENKILNSLKPIDHTPRKYLLVDPTDIEERCMDGKLVIGMNRHREICTMQLSGNILLLKDQIKRCVQIAATKVTQLTDYIQAEVAKSNEVAKSKGIREFNKLNKEQMMTF
jgi:exosome complex component RRP45